MKKTLSFIFGFALVGGMLAGCEKYPPPITADQIASFSVPGGKASEENEAFALRIVNGARNARESCSINIRQPYGQFADYKIAELKTESGETYEINQHPGMRETFAVSTQRKYLYLCFSTEDFDKIMNSFFPKEN